MLCHFCFDNINLLVLRQAIFRWNVFAPPVISNKPSTSVSWIWFLLIEECHEMCQRSYRGIKLWSEVMGVSEFFDKDRMRSKVINAGGVKSVFGFENISP